MFAFILYVPTICEGPFLRFFVHSNVELFLDLCNMLSIQHLNVILFVEIRGDFSMVDESAKVDV